MEFSLLVQFEERFHRPAIEAGENPHGLKAAEQQWFVWVDRRRENPALALENVQSWTLPELTEALNRFFVGSDTSVH